MGEKTCKIVSEEGATMIELKNVRVENNRLVVTGALMGAWDTDMYMDADDIKAAVGIVDLPAVIKYIATNVLGITVTKTA
ncbi:MAG: hypothetical protein IKD70_09140 [Eggerthellaceae bacterium]|nr:hypothetical protein [Eggerthellaceae bacterium]